MHSVHSTRFPRWLLLLCSLAVSYVLARYAKHGLDLLNARYSFDDAYFFVRYAQHALHGHGHSWNIGEPPVYGSTSLLHFLFVLVLSSKPLLPPLAVPSVSSWLMGLASILALTWVSGRLAQHDYLHRKYILFGTLYITTFMSQPHFLFHSKTGMETMLALFCNSLLILSAFRLAVRATPWRLFLTVLACYISFLARPDSGLYVTLFPLLAILLLSQEKTRHRTAAFFAFSLISLLTIDAFLKNHFLGSPLPLSFYVKTLTNHDLYQGHYRWDPFLQSHNYLITILPFIILIVFFWQAVPWRQAVVLLAPLVATYAYYFSTVQIMGHYGRYYIPGAPFVILFAVFVLDNYLQLNDGRVRFSFRTFCTRACLVVLLVFFSKPVSKAASRVYLEVVQSEYSLPTAKYYNTRSQRELPELDSAANKFAVSAILERAPAGVRVAATEHGYVSARSPDVTIIDMTGLHNPALARKGFAATVVLDQKPDLIWMPPSDRPGMIEGFLASEEFWANYRFYPQAYNHGLAIRKNGERREVLEEIFARSWAETYPGFNLTPFEAIPTPR